MSNYNQDDLFRLLHVMLSRIKPPNRDEAKAVKSAVAIEETTEAVVYQHFLAGR